MSKSPQTAASSPPSITTAKILAYAAPSVGISFLMGPMGVALGIYAKYYGMALTSIAAVLLVSRLFDAVTDPLIGWLSDRYRVRNGTRKPFILVGGLCVVPCSVFLFVPPDDVSVAYFALWSLAFYLAFTIYTLPNGAWASEITTDPVERTKVFTLLSIVGQVGMLLFYAVPYLPMFETTAFTPETLKVSVIIGAVLIVPGLYLALKYAPNGPPPIKTPTEKKMSWWVGVRLFFRAVKANRPFLIYVAANMSFMFGLGMFGGAFFIFVDSFLGLGEKFAPLATIGLVAGLLIIPIAYKLTVWLGKRKMWISSTLVMMFSVFYAGSISPGDDAFIGLVVVQLALTFGGICGSVLGPAIMSDIIDYGLLRDSTERRGAYFSIFAMLLKAQGAVGGALGLAAAGWLGYDATATEHSEASALGIRMAVSWLPLAISSIALIFIWLIPLDERRNAIVRRRLNCRAERQARAVEEAGHLEKQRGFI